MDVFNKTKSNDETVWKESTSRHASTCLLIGVDVKPKLAQGVPVAHKLVFKVVDFTVSKFPKRLCAEPLDTLHQHAPVPCGEWVHETGAVTPSVSRHVLQHTLEYYFSSR